MSNLFAPTAKQQVKQAVQPGAPKPTLVKPNGAPVPVLQELGFSGGIADFNSALEGVVNAHVQQHGYQPKPDVALRTVIASPPLRTTIGQPAGLVKPGNINIFDRPVVYNPDGSYSTVRSISIGDDRGRGVLIPTVVPTKNGFAVVSNKAAVAHYRKTGENLGTFTNEAAANAYAETLHEQQQAQQHTFGPPSASELALQQHPVQTDAQFVTEMRKQAQGPGWDAWLHENGDRVQQLAGEKQWQAQVHAVVLSRNSRDATVTRAQAAGLTPEEAQQAAAHKQAADVVGLHSLGAIARPAGQIIDALVHSPAGVYMLGDALVRDTLTQVAHPLTVQHHPHTLPLLKATAEGVKQDIQHPKENAGYLFLDLLGIASLGGGLAARAAEVARTGDAGALLRKPPLKRATINLGGFSEEMPLSSNPLVAYAQQKVLGQRERAANLRIDQGPSVLRSILGPQGAQDFIDRNFSFERKVGREATARERTDFIAQMSLSHQLEQAAGTATTQSRVLGRMPATMKRGLTRGEQKAIFNASWDDPNPLEAERQFHLNMIEAAKEGEPGISIKAHQQHLADLKLAEMALANPRPRFLKALELTRAVIAEQQAVRISKLGLAPETAEGRIAKAAQVLRGEAPTGGKQEHAGFYLPTQPRGKVKRPPSQARGRFSLSAGPFGTPPGRDLAELTHSFEGDAMRAGDIRIDATNLAIETAARTFRAATVKDAHAKLWESALEVPPVGMEQWYKPIRDVNTIPDELRAVFAKMDEGKFTNAEAELLPEDMQAVLREMYPSEKKLTGVPIKHVKWYDSRLNPDASKPIFVPGAGTTAAQTINTPFRFTALYLRPAYALNKLGNAAMLVFDQGFLNSIENVSRAMAVTKLYGEKNAAQIRAHVGAGRSRSYVAKQSGHISRAVAEFWNRFADRDERVASFLYYADRKGYKTPEEMDRLLNDESARADLSEVERRANKALVQFDNLTDIEKNHLRHIIFVYPWVRGAAVWSLRAIMEHPAKTAILAQLGRQAIQNEPFLDHAPEWFKRIGYIPVGWNHDGTPKVVNPTSVNTFSTLSDFLAIGKAGTVGDKYASASDLFGPATSFFVHATTGRDEFGNDYPGSQWAGAAKDVLAGLPQLSKQLKKKTNEPPSKFDIRNRASLEASLNSAIHETVFSPGWLDGYGSLIAGGLSPRGANTNALAARYWADQDPKVRTARELRLLNLALSKQGEFLGRPVPKEVRQAVHDAAAITDLYAQHNKDTGSSPNTKARDSFVIDYLRKEGRITPDQATRLKGQLRPLVDANVISDFSRMLKNKYLAGKDLRQWDSDVRLLYSFRKDIFNRKASALAEQGLSPQARYNVPQEKLNEYGRKYVAWADEVRKARAKGADAADLRLMQDEHSKPVGGLPSFAAIAWANQTPQEQQKAMNQNLGAGWETLSAVEKQLLGKPVDPAVTEAWRAYSKLTTPESLAKQLPAGQRSLDKDQRLAVVKQIDRYYNLGGKFLQDYLFSKQKLYQRLGYMNAVKDSPHRADWQELLKQANTLETAVANKQTTQTAARDAWHDYAANLETYYRTERPGFWKELQPILRDDPEFLTKLIS